MSKKLPILVKLVEPQPTQKHRFKRKNKSSLPVFFGELSASEEEQAVEIGKIIFSKETTSTQKGWETIGALIFAHIQTLPDKGVKEGLHFAQNIITKILRNSAEKKK